MMRFDADAGAGTVSFKAARPFYSKQSVAIAAHVFESKARVSLSENAKSFEVALKSKRNRTTAAELEALAGEFFNEMLNQEYRLVVGDSNKKIADLIVTQALYCAGGAGEGVKPRAHESAPEFKAAVDRLMKDARAEILATMPPKIPRKGEIFPA